MQTIYQPGLASENCLLVPIGMFVVLSAALVAVMLLIRSMVPGHRRSRRQLVGILAGLPLLVGVLVVFLVASGRDSIVRIATDGDWLEYRYCRRLELHVERHPLTAISGSDYRQERSSNSRGRVRITHYALLHVDGRAEPIRFMLQAGDSVLDLGLLGEIAPEALRGYRAATGR